MMRTKYVYIYHSLCTYCYTCMQFDSHSAHGTFQFALNIIPSGVLSNTCLDYVDNVVFFSEKNRQPVKEIDQVLIHLRQY